MIHSIIPDNIIFPDTPSDISYIRRNGVIIETENGQLRRIISTNPSDYLNYLTRFEIIK